jgi:hypothetical protein
LAKVTIEMGDSLLFYIRKAMEKALDIDG